MVYGPLKRGGTSRSRTNKDDQTEREGPRRREGREEGERREGGEGERKSDDLDKRKGCAERRERGRRY